MWLCDVPIATGTPPQPHTFNLYPYKARMNPESSRPLFFGTESAVPLGNNNRSDADIAVTENQQPAPVHSEFAFSDGNIELQTTDQTFWVHEYHLNKFAAFATLIQAAKSSAAANSVLRIIVACDKKTKGEDVYNTLKVIYASHIDGIPDFDSSTLTSTLRIASFYDYPALRKFAISKLEGMSLPAIERIQLSDELSLPTWETPAFTELCSRKEPISQSEAEILGMTRFVEIARIREVERTRLAVQFAGRIYGELLQASELTPLAIMNPESSRLSSFDVESASLSNNSMLTPDASSPHDILTQIIVVERSDADTAVAENQQPAPVHPEFAFSDGNIELQTTDQTFWVHEYHLNKFAAFAAIIQAAKNSAIPDSGRRIVVGCDKKTKGVDVYNTLKVIYASHIDGIPDFDSSTLTSTLRIASTFDYPALRKFAIKKLEGMSIPAIERIQLSDELSLPTWETPAFSELCSRKEPISQPEAEILGMTRFVEIARIRETERTRLAVKFAEGVYGELLKLQTSELVDSSPLGGSDGSGSVQNTFGQSMTFLSMY
ncbi:unnamed protein product [Rhizoctonia solani]|nr:unnamed protein product [Rhizoctonia solani]